MLDFSTIEFDYEPFPIGIARPALAGDLYAEMVSNFPPLDLFKTKEEKGVKYSLSQVNHRRQYDRFVADTPVWSRFHAYVKSRSFLEDTFAMLRGNGIDLGAVDPGFGTRVVGRAKALFRGSPLPDFPRMRSRFEFSSMPVTGGSIRPHTDNPTKIVTMVVPILADGEWDHSVGGGTSVVRPKDVSRTFNRRNFYLDFDEVERVKTFAFEPNQCLVFIKTYNSWHAVWPMTGTDPNRLRRTLTINIEAS